MSKHTPAPLYAPPPHQVPRQPRALLALFWPGRLAQRCRAQRVAGQVLKGNDQEANSIRPLRPHRLRSTSRRASLGTDSRRNLARTMMDNGRLNRALVAAIECFPCARWSPLTQQLRRHHGMDSRNRHEVRCHRPEMGLASGRLYLPKPGTRYDPTRHLKALHNHNHNVNRRRRYNPPPKRRSRQFQQMSLATRLTPRMITQNWAPTPWQLRWLITQSSLPK